ncbi:MAG: PAS domain-containing protein [Chitinispirillaceae bacterium]
MHAPQFYSHTGIYDSDGQLKGTRGCVVDISQRKNIERALRRSEEKFRSMVETAQEGIWVVDCERVIQYANRRLATMLGYPVNQITGKPVSLFVSGRDHQYLN